MINKLLNALFPEKCPACSDRAMNHRTAPFCADCWAKIIPYSNRKCERCGKPLVSEFALFCQECLTDQPAFHRARSYGLYEGVLKQAINLFKYHGIRRLSQPLSEILLRLDLPDVDFLIPVPLHKKRLREREYNQSSLLARHLAKRLKKGFINDCLIRRKETLPQVGLRSGERTQNVKNAFFIRNAVSMKNKKIMLIDDVVTTGSTIRECAKILRKAGAADIYVMSLAHGLTE